MTTRASPGSGAQVDGGANHQRRCTRLAARTITDRGGDVDVVTIAEFAAPEFSADVQRDEGLPTGAEEFRRRLEQCQALLICSSEHNASLRASTRTCSPSPRPS